MYTAWTAVCTLFVISSAFSKCKGIITDSDRLFAYHVFAADTKWKETRFHWSSRLSYVINTDWNALDFYDITRHPGVIKQCLAYEGGILMLLSESIAYGVFLGPPLYYDFNKKLSSVGTPCWRSAVSTPRGVFFLGNDNVYLIQGLSSPKEIGNDIKNELFRVISPSNFDTTFGVSNSSQSEYRIYSPSDGVCFVYNWETGGWSVESRTDTAAGNGLLVDTVVIDSLAGGTMDSLTGGTINSLSQSSGDKVLLVGTSDYYLKKLNYSDHDSAPSKMKSPLFRVGGLGKKARYQGITFNGKGTIVTVDFIDSTGSIIQSIQQTLTTSYVDYNLWIDRAMDGLQVEFRTSSSNWFDIRYYRLMYLDYGRL